MMRVVIFGVRNDSQEYSRNYILRKAFADIGCSILPCTVDFGYARPGSGPLFKILYALFFAPVRWITLLCQYLALPPHDIIFVPYPAHMDSWLACILSKLHGKKVIVDAFFGLYDTIVRDRGLFQENSLMARLIRRYEQGLLRSADIILVDTEAQVRLLQTDFQLSESRVMDIPVGINESLWTPAPFPETPLFQVVFWATFIPLHGVEIVAQAARQLENHVPEIRFTVIGTGQLSGKFKKILETHPARNLTWIDRFIPLEDIRKHVENAHCCLGIFSQQEKAQRCIPYKAYQTLASARPLITGRTIAAASLFSDGTNAVLVDPGKPPALAQAVSYLADNRDLAESIGKKGRELYEARLSNQVIGKKLEKIIRRISIASE
jgi:glycosyltransferase involved in cell wall biosynthesis